MAKEKVLESGYGYNQSLAADKANPKISIITQHYNINERYIRRAIESILNQTFTDFEYIISDNASTDSTAVILDEYAVKDNRIRVIHQKENLPVKAFEDIICNVVKGDYIAFLDNDDYYEPVFLQEMYTLAQKTNADLVACGTEMYKEEDERKRGVRTYKDLYLDDCTKLSTMFHDVVWVAYATFWCKLFKHKIVKDMLAKDVFGSFSSYHDTMFCLAYALHSKSLAITSKVLHHYCMRSNSQVYKWSKAHLDCALGTYILFKQCLNKWRLESTVNLTFITNVLVNNVNQILFNINQSESVNITEAIELIHNIATDCLIHEVSQNSSYGAKLYQNLILVVIDLMLKTQSQEEKQKLRDNFLYKVCNSLLILGKGNGRISKEILEEFLAGIYAQDNKFRLGRQYLYHIINAYDEEMYSIINTCNLDFILSNPDFTYSILWGKEQYPIIKDLTEHELIQEYSDIVYEISKKSYSNAFGQIINCYEAEQNSHARLALLETASTLAALDQNEEGFIFADKMKAKELINLGDYGNAAALVLDMEKMLPGDEDILYFRVQLMVKTNFRNAAQQLADKIAVDPAYTDKLKKRINELFE